MKVIIYIKKGDSEIRWDDCSQNEKKEISAIINNQGLRSLGYVPK